MSTDDAKARDPLLAALRGLAIGRIALGAASLAAPGALARGLSVKQTPELDYMTRIFGARAIALGVGYLTTPQAERPRWQRLSLMVDITDTAHGTAHLVRGDLPRSAAVAMVALTGTYMSVGATRFITDMKVQRAA
ncbi:hypothetical protein L5G32_14240 [Gordonia sp. HY002]|uniref:hypothetical protein n=1 Tax=Gordonia zhenghanii TaxID=2911516 RepID=UPI001EEFB559|nr:hypothetical protein [Gordonia zhenghanii]MCF8571428.1 hypothetical protein [Gordonia zhenghanii]MCF8608257.1 hypothetical protein [Gordonia zhenghanii]